MKTTTAYKPIRLCIIEDHLLFSEGLRNLLADSNEFEICAIATTIKDGLDRLKQIEVDILLLDINLPDGNGLNLFPVLQKLKPNLKVVILSMFNEISYMKTAELKGFSGYFPKNIPIQLLIKHLKEICEGKKVFFRNDTSLLHSSQCILSSKEIEVLNFLRFGKNVNEIAVLMGNSAETIRSHKKNIAKKTKTHSVIEMIEKAKTLGWIV